MSLETGDRLGRYEILGPLGAGGMGEVYRARDTELERDVAIKVLPEAVAQNPDRLKRFRREAKAVAKLAHPNILEIWDYGTEGDTTYSVTELLEGETLRERLEGGALGWRKATDIGAAIADGLGAAHEAGIVHRDLKPSNVFLTADGRVKVLDFGLARHDEVGAGKGETAVPTMTRQTDPGTVMGTVGYMSPEQVRGETVDQRSDIFSLGCVLYEMVAGRQTFKGDTAAETMTAILKEEPEDLSTSGVALPQELAGTVRRCLEKRPQARFQSASDLAYNLRTMSSASTSAAGYSGTRTGGLRMATPWLAAGAVAVIAVGTWWMLKGRSEQAADASPGLDPNKVVVAVLENRTDEPAFDSLALQISDLIIQGVRQHGHVEVVERPVPVPLPPSAQPDGRGAAEGDWVQSIAEASGAGLVVFGSMYRQGDKVEVQARLTDAIEHRLLCAFDPVRGPPDTVGELGEQLWKTVSVAVSGYVGGFLDPAVQRLPTFEAFRFLQSNQDKWGHDRSAVRNNAEQAVLLDPSCPTLLFRLFYVCVFQGERDKAAQQLDILEEQISKLTPFERHELEFARGMFEGNPHTRVNSARKLVRMAPRLGMYRAILGPQEMAVNRPRAAVEALHGVPPTMTGGGDLTPVFLAQSHHLLGEYQHQLDVANAALERSSDRHSTLAEKAGALAALGRVEEVLEVVETGLSLRETEAFFGRFHLLDAAISELTVHGHGETATAIAERAVTWYRSQNRDQIPDWHDGMLRALIGAGRWAEAQELADGLTAELPDDIRVLGYRAEIAIQRGDRATAQRVADRLKDLVDQDPMSRLNTYVRGEIKAQLGDKQRAVDLLRQVQGESFWPSLFLDLHQNIFFEPLWDYPPFQEFIRPKG